MKRPSEPPLKVGLVAAGYVGAFVVASLVVMLYVALTSGPDRQGAQGMYAFGGYHAVQNAGLAADLPWWFGLSPIRILVAPLFALVFLLAALFAPNRFSRIALLAAVLVESGIFVWVVLIWLRPFRS